MLLFKLVHVPMILAGTKTQTRRLWKTQRVKVGSVQKCYSGGLPISRCPSCGGDRGFTGIGAEDACSFGCRVCHGTGRLQPFASVRILRVWREEIRDMTPAEIAAEGYPGKGVHEFAQILIDVNRLKWSVAYVMHLPLFALEFEPEAR